MREVETRRPRVDDEFFLRCRYRHYARPRQMPHLPRSLRPLVYVRDLPRLVGVRRLGAPPLPLHVSADWLTLGRRAVAAVLAAGADRGLTRYFRRVVVPSEAFFASVLLNDRALRSSATTAASRRSRARVRPTRTPSRAPTSTAS